MRTIVRPIFKRMVFELLLGAVAVLMFQPSASKADYMTWQMQNATDETIYVSFFSLDRKYVWPGNGKTFVLNDRYVKSYELTDCKSFERICYGAWTAPRADKKVGYWGVGPQNTATCNDCCYQCDGRTTPRRVLGHAR